jgi:hypothetical protein
MLMLALQHWSTWKEPVTATMYSAVEWPDANRVAPGAKGTGVVESPSGAIHFGRLDRRAASS